MSQHVEKPTGSPGSNDVEIRLGLIDGADGSCPVWVSGPDDRRADGRFQSPFSAAEVDEALRWMDEGTPDTAAARGFGERLFVALFQGPVGGVFAASQDPASPPRIRLTIDEPAIARLPWELLADPATGGNLALRSRFVRGIATESRARPLSVEPPLRILVVDAAPRGLERLDAESEAVEIERELSAVVAQSRVEVVPLRHVTLERLVNAIREGATGTPPRPIHVLHWIGHGAVDPSSRTNVLLFEDVTGGEDPVDGNRLADVLAGTDVRLVLLNACHSAAPTASTGQPTSSQVTGAIADVLLTSGIPAVIGMRVSVLDTTARRFAGQFYAALADGRGIDEAVLDARRLVAGRAPGAAAEIGVPVVYLRRGDAELLSTVEPLTRRQRFTSRFRRFAPVVAIAGFVVVTLAAVGIERSADAILKSIQGPARMTGDFNVAVTEFDERDAEGDPVRTAAGTDLSVRLGEALTEDLADVESAQIEVRSPDEAGRLPGATADERAVEAGRLAERIDADVVIYGWLDPTRTTLQPEFFVREENLADAEELGGSFRLGSAIQQSVPIDSEAAAGIQVREALVSRARALAGLVLGLSYFRVGDFDEADRHFDVALAAEGWHPSDGKEILYLFRGSSAGARGQLDEARAWYQRAVELNPGFARGRLGLAEVRLQESKGTCERDWIHPERPQFDAAGLRDAVALYRDALAAPDQPASANVPAKAHLGIARTYLCMSQAGIEDRWADAANEAGLVIADFEAGNQALAAKAAEAHGVRAFAALPAAGDPDREGRLRSAEAEWRAAIAIPARPERLAAFHAGLADVLRQQGRIDDARRAYDEAVLLAPEADRARYERLRDQLTGAS